jgi:P27 family predicted phage terminase small subunit
MPRGRPPKPLEQIRATQRDATHKANGTAIVPYSGTVDRTVPDAPLGVTGRAADEWHNVWIAGHWLKRDQDYHWVEMIARAYGDIEIFRARVAEDGLVATGYAGQVVAHPLIAEIRKCEATIQKCLQILGFSPTDRAKLTITDAKAASAVQEFLGRNKNVVPV